MWLGWCWAFPIRLVMSHCDRDVSAVLTLELCPRNLPWYLVLWFSYTFKKKDNWDIVVPSVIPLPSWSICSKHLLSSNSLPTNSVCLLCTYSMEGDFQTSWKHSQPGCLIILVIIKHNPSFSSFFFEQQREKSKSLQNSVTLKSKTSVTVDI